MAQSPCRYQVQLVAPTDFDYTLDVPLVAIVNDAHVLGKVVSVSDAERRGQASLLDVGLVAELLPRRLRGEAGPHLSQVHPRLDFGAEGIARDG